MGRCCRISSQRARGRYRGRVGPSAWTGGRGPWRRRDAAVSRAGGARATRAAPGGGRRRRGARSSTALVRSGSPSGSTEGVGAVPSDLALLRSRSGNVAASRIEAAALGFRHDARSRTLPWGRPRWAAGGRRPVLKCFEGRRRSQGCLPAHLTSFRSRERRVGPGAAGCSRISPRRARGRRLGGVGLGERTGGQRPWRHRDAACFAGRPCSGDASGVRHGAGWPGPPPGRPTSATRAGIRPRWSGPRCPPGVDGGGRGRPASRPGRRRAHVPGARRLARWVGSDAQFPAGAGAAAGPAGCSGSSTKTGITRSVFSWYSAYGG
ncbi:hypothetical protein CLV72_11123 [Allonocardiopsis opalescens]|uniref:Uncharacterized protein n=1 Tax=Allonocardiopsis opalescens TaxID=1144618 RepID=A0A2T0PTA7_9ACTN|nr:hypothetical protein CLV72_11123 [Allonocardiopsis opalescens]